jgi:hypothetical protein
MTRSAPGPQLPAVPRLPPYTAGRRQKRAAFGANWPEGLVHGQRTLLICQTPMAAAAATAAVAPNRAG